MDKRDAIKDPKCNLPDGVLYIIVDGLMGPGYQNTGGPGNQRTREPEDKRTIGQENRWARELVGREPVDKGSSRLSR